MIIRMEPLTKKEKVSSMDPDWTQMPTEIQELVCKCLRLPDQLRFGSVCSSWHSSTSNKSYIWVPDTPWFIINDDNHPEFHLISTKAEKNFKIDKPFRPTDGFFIVGSSKGWLVIQSQAEIFILNVFSRIRIELPPRSSMPDVLKTKGTESSGMDTPLASAMTTCDRFNPIFVAIVTSAGDLAWCKIGDEAWKGHRGGNGEEYVNLTFHKEKLFAIRSDGSKIDMFQVEEESLVLLPLGSIDYPSQSHPQDPTSQALHFYLVESKGSLLVVKRSGLNERTVGFHVMKMEENYCQQKLVYMDNLDGQALFLSDMNSESFPPEHCQHPGNRIYYIGHSNSSAISELGVFSVKGCGRRFMVPLPRSNITTFWVMPRFVFDCKCKCHDSALRKWEEMHALEN